MAAAHLRKALSQTVTITQIESPHVGGIVRKESYRIDKHCVLECQLDVLVWVVDDTVGQFPSVYTGLP